MQKPVYTLKATKLYFQVVNCMVCELYPNIVVTCWKVKVKQKFFQTNKTDNQLPGDSSVEEIID